MNDMKTVQIKPSEDSSPTSAKEFEGRVRAVIPHIKTLFDSMCSVLREDEWVAIFTNLQVRCIICDPKDVSNKETIINLTAGVQADKVFK